jgi:hypothetical protein
MAFARKSKRTVQRLWRPDFRELQSLPDTKVIRTGFLLNLLAIAVTLGVLTAYLIKEYTLQTVAGSVTQLEQQVAGGTAENRAILDANKRFKQSAAVMEEVIAFDLQPVNYPALVRDVAAVIPQGMLLTALELRADDGVPAKGKEPPFVAEFAGRIGSTSDGSTPSQVLSRFQDAIGNIPSLAGKQLQMDLTRFNRNNELDHFEFTLIVLIYPDA